MKAEYMTPIIEGFKESVGLAVTLIMTIAVGIASVAFAFVNHLPIRKPGNKQRISAG